MWRQSEEVGGPTTTGVVSIVASAREHKAGLPGQKLCKPGPDGQLQRKIARPSRRERALTPDELSQVRAECLTPVWPARCNAAATFAAKSHSALDPARARPLTSASARQRPVRPGLPRNTIFRSCPCRLLCLRSARGLERRLPTPTRAVPGTVGARTSRAATLRGDDRAGAGIMTSNAGLGALGGSGWHRAGTAPGPTAPSA